MAIHSERNEYPGINAHLNSYLQNTSGEWASFHAEHIVDLSRSLRAVLPSGYFARVEKSLQLREEAIIRHRRPDVTIYSQPPIAKPQSMAVATDPSVVAVVDDTMDVPEDYYLNAIVIYSDEDGKLGKLVTRIELLSPTNKPPNEGYLLYRDKRNAGLISGTPLVEIDYLHQTLPPIRGLPSYPDQEENAQPFAILVSDPRPSTKEGLAKIYTFHTDDKLPTIEIPLVGDDVLVFDLNPAYQATFENEPFYQSVIDYEQLPLNFESYTPADQERIKARMQAPAEKTP